MPIKDYYSILGVPPDESSSGIRTAYRNLVKRHHPDVAGAGETGRFQEITEAYEVLSDPDRRRLYNEQLAQSRGAVSASGLRRPVGETGSGTIPLRWRSSPLRPVPEPMRGRGPRHWGGAEPLATEPARALDLELILTPAEARQGGELPVRVPVFQTCPACGGSGEDWLFLCSECSGAGVVEQWEFVSLRIPAGVASGTVLEFLLRGPMAESLRLRIHLRVSPY